MTREVPRQEGHMDELRAVPGTFTPEELRSIRRQYYEFLLPRFGSSKRARELTRLAMAGYIDPSQASVDIRPLIRPLPNLGVKDE